MRFLNPAGLLTSILALPIIALYFLRLQRQQLAVPSILLWDAVRVDHHANRPWQKLRRNWLLILQLLVLLCLVFAFAQPALPVPLDLRGHVVVLLDASASMQAVQAGGQTRFSVALERLRDLSWTLNGDALVTVIAVGPEPNVLVRSGTSRDLRQILNTVAPLDGPANWGAAAALAAGLASGEQMTTLLVTDAAVDDALPSLPGSVRLITVGDDVPNAGIVAFSLRRAAGGMTAFVRVRNAGPAAHRDLSLYVDGSLVERRRIALESDEDLSLSFSDLPELHWAEARLELIPEVVGTDGLALDDHAWVAVSGEQGGRVLLLTSGNRFLEQGLRTLPGLTVDLSVIDDVLADEGGGPSDSVEGGLTPAVGQSYSLIVADGPLTRILSQAPGLWLIAPGPGTLCGTPGDSFTPTVAVRGSWTHSLLRYVDWHDVHIARAYRYTLPADAETLIEDVEGPLLWTVERPGQRMACMAFDLHDSDLPLRMAFPLLTANLVGWLMPQTSLEPVAALPAGASWRPSLPADAQNVTVTAPGGGRMVFRDLDAAIVPPTQAGLYQIETETSVGRIRQYAALALLDAAESDLRARTVIVGGTTLPESSGAETGWRELSKWPLLAALVFLFAEGFLWWRVQPRPLDFHPGRTDRKLKGWHAYKQWLQRLVGAGTQVLRSLFTRRTSPALLSRLVLLLLLLLAFFDLRWTRQTRDLATVFLLDRSASTQRAWDAALAFVQTALAEKSARDRAAVVVFGGDAWVDRRLTTVPELDLVATFPRAEATDIEEAVRLGLALIPEGAPGRMVLLTDGLATEGDGERALQEARLRDVDLLMVPMGEGVSDAEIWIEDLQLPTQVYPGDRVSAVVTVGSGRDQRVDLGWTVGQQSGQGALDLISQHASFVFSFNAAEPGFLPLRVCVTAEDDVFTQNNCATGWVIVQGPPRVLVIGETDERRVLVTALTDAGLVVESREPGELPLTLQGIADYTGVVLVNTPARTLAPSALQALKSYVRDLGGGVVAVGGPESYGVGGWLGTPLEEILPVMMQVQDPRRFPPLAMAIVIDKSGSMSAEEAGVPKIRLAAEAAARVAETLNDTDTLAVVAFDDRPADTIGPVFMDQREDVMAQLLRLQAGGGGIYVRESLAYAAELLRGVEDLPGQQRHILLLADGSDAEHQEGVLGAATQLQEEGITVSVVSIGEGSDVPFLNQLSQVGKGRFYLAQQAADLPAIFAEEAAHAKRSYIVEETFYPQPLTTWEPLAELRSTPPLHGYVATTPKGTAQVIWRAAKYDPLLSAWQYGLGRTVAWTSDAAGRWAAGWVTWDDFARFWGSVVRWVLLPASDADLSVQVRAQGEGALVTVDVVDSDGVYVDDLNLGIQALRPGSEAASHATALDQVAPGRYEGSFVPPDTGALLLRIYGDRNVTTGWAQPYAPEYIPGNASQAVARLASIGDAVVTEDPAAAFVHNLQGREVGQPLAPWLLLVALFLWPLDIAWRRLSLSRTDWARMWNWVRANLIRKPEMAVPSEPPDPTLASALRERRRTSAGVSKGVLLPKSGVGEGEDRAVPPVAHKMAKGKSASDAPPSSPHSGDENETLAARLKRRVKE